MDSPKIKQSDRSTVLVEVLLRYQDGTTVDLSHLSPEQMDALRARIKRYVDCLGTPCYQMRMAI